MLAFLDTELGLIPGLGRGRYFAPTAPGPAAPFSYAAFCAASILFLCMKFVVGALAGGCSRDEESCDSFAEL